MQRKFLKNKVILVKIHRKKPIYAIFILILVFFPSFAVADESGITITMRRNMGTDLGNKIGGDWTISGSGPEGTIKIAILFNDTEVYSVQGKEFSFRFNTDDYWVGEVIIIVRAYLSDSEFVYRTFVREFIDSSFDNMIFAFTGGIFAIVIIIYVVRYKKNKEMTKKEIKIEDVKIDG